MIKTCQQPAVDHCEHATVDFDHALTCLPVYIGNLLHVRVVLEGVGYGTRDRVTWLADHGGVVAVQGGHRVLLSDLAHVT